jgi:hypothetical protein
MAQEMNVKDVLNNIGFSGASSKGGAANKLPLIEASYVVEIHKGSFFASTNPQTKGQPIFSVDFTVREASTDKVATGSKKSWVQNLTPYSETVNYGAENLKQFVAAVFGFEPGSEEADNISDDFVEQITSGGADGSLVRLDTVPKTSKANRDWLLHIWSPYNED